MRSVVAHGVLAAGGLALAYSVWTDADVEERSPQQVDVTACEEIALTEVTFDAEERDVYIELRSEGEEKLAWIVSERKQAEGDPHRTEFVGGKPALEYIEKLAPLPAIRSLGELVDERLAELDLKEPKTKF